MKNATRRKFKVSHGKASLWVSPYKTGWRFRWREHPDRTDEPLEEIFRTTKLRAEEAALACLKKLPGALDLTLLTPARRAWLEAVNRETSPNDQDAVLDFLSSRKKSALLLAAVERFILFKTPNGKVSTPHQEQVERDLRNLAATLSNKLVTDITLDDLQGWWDARTGTAGDARRRGLRTTLVMFWRWARKDGIAGNDVDPLPSRLAQIEAPAGSLRILDLAELEFLLSIVEKEFLPLIVLGAFQGIRPEELAPKKESSKPGLRWEHIDWKWNTITVPKEVAKTRRVKSARARKMPFHPVARAWLEAIGAAQHWTGPICPRNPTDIHPRATTAWGKALDKQFRRDEGWPQDALRHSYASYRNAVIRNLPQVAEEMGTSETQLHAHYHNPRDTREGEAWFAFLPSSARVLAPYISLPKNSPNFEEQEQSSPSKVIA